MIRQISCLYFACGARTYKIEKRRTTFLESNDAARLHFLHLLFGVS